ncbi:LuxR C-terminal-related transcriptional regulator [Planotetraspora sp. A-T 1434]|uniref:LuxR C-terminal-related transcriptional regulator n=1 Tax=Planotetraspora sp. A-T 1434 TaxID=2979219 RepID=UPI0021C198C7|nr:LuxR C-terminal-related transcriptional regulator [Planotetraspora sp. A-T 1434]MCT9933721.1 LuxR C-terminal-related transcriptional regulator [Planotetraspora sp. A-T 1434]
MAEIADFLFLSEGTAKTHVSRALTKLGLAKPSSTPTNPCCSTPTRAAGSPPSTWSRTATGVSRSSRTATR